MSRIRLPATAAVAALCVLASAAVTRAAALHTVSLLSDGRDEMRVAGGSMTVEHLSWSLPSNLQVDGVARSLSWNGNTSNPIAVPVAAAGEYWVRKTAGRDGGYAVQRASGFALATVDNPNGGDTYQFELHASPATATTDWMRVRAGNGNVAGAFDFTGVGGYVPAAPNATDITFSLSVDGSDELMFTNGSLVVRHLSWDNPTSLLINGQPQALTWNGNTSNAIPLNLPDHFQFTQLAGRSTLYPVETPLGMVIGAADELVGADTYRWKLTPVPEPTGCALAFAAAAASALARRRRRP
jgi:hypothetical protein